MRGRVLGALFAIGLVAGLLWPRSADALDPADSFDIIFTTAYGSVLESGDLLHLIYYNIDYLTVPTAATSTATVAYLGHYYDTSAATIRASEPPFTHVNSGYGSGVIGIYFTPAQVTAASIAWGDSDQGRITGNPSVFGSPQSLSKNIQWRAQASAKDELRDDILEIANALEQRPEWSGMDLVDDSILQASGERYFENAIPNLRTMAPSLFSGAFENPDFIFDTHATSYATALEETLAGSRLSDANVWQNLADWWNLPVVMVKSLFTIGLGIAVTGFVISRTREPGIALPMIGIVFAAAATIGWLPLQFVAVLGFLGLLLIAFMVWMKRAA